jgi:hypothetical protein
MTRIGKIARLPRFVRHELNQRLHNGEIGLQLVAWLNARDDVRAVLATHFGGHAISAQNLSEWKKGGFEDWLHEQETRDRIRILLEDSAEFGGGDGKISLGDTLSVPMMVALGRCINQIAAEALDDPARQKNLVALIREVSHLRHGDYKSGLLKLQHERLATRGD